MKQTACLRFLLTTCFLSVLLTGCASIAPPAQNQNIAWSSRSQSLSQLTAWQLRGKLAFRSPADSGSASLNWNERANHYVLTLFAPLGAGGMTLTGNDHDITLKTDNGQMQHSNDPSELLRQNGGPPLPVQNLRYWIRGLPAPFSPAQKQWDTYGRLSQVKQDGWQIDYLSYTHAHNLDLPSRLNASSDQVKIKLMIYQWE